MTDCLGITADIYQAFGKGDIPFIMEQLADDVQWEQWDNWSPQQAGVPWLTHRTGKAGALEFFQIIGGWQITDFQVKSLMAGGNQAAAEIVIAVTLPGSGVSFRDEELHLWTFNDAGKVTRFRHYVDTAKHIAAAKGAATPAAAG